ncbi:MAG: hypothetical protein KIT16_12680 [Rhodospirillaceae bacterium]|nr:hypothetical protein [Rhodospirillaceae bacterium]
MLLRKFVFAALCTAGFAGSAIAGPGQCYYPGGQAVGPIYNTDRPDYSWIDWVQRQGGVCRRVSTIEEQTLRSRGLGYPSEYRAGYQPPNYRPPGYRPPGYQPPGYQPPGYQPPTQGWYGDPNRAAYLIGQWFGYQGRPYAQVRDTGRYMYLHGRSWRVFRVRWQDGGRAQVAARLARNGSQYFAIQSYDAANWTQPQPIGQ